MQELAEFLGVTVEYLRKILRGDRHLHFLKAQKLGKLLKCDKDIWMDPKRIEERKDVFKKYMGEETV